MWILRTTAAEGEPERTFRVLPGVARTIGRSTGADFILDAALVSRVHCQLLALGDGALEVRDLESTNGTYVNGAASSGPACRLETRSRWAGSSWWRYVMNEGFGLWALGFRHGGPKAPA